MNPPLRHPLGRRIDLGRHARYVSCLGGPPDYRKTAFLIESNGADFTPVEMNFLAMVAGSIRVNAQHPDLFQQLVSHFPFEPMIDLAVKRDMAGVQAANIPNSTGRA